MLRATDDECRGDLLARAQRGALSLAEQAALRAHLASCESCRMLHQVASDFASVSAVERGDEARIEQMSAAARRAAAADGGRRAGRPRMPTSVRAASAAAGLVLLAGTASAAVWLLPLLARKLAPEKSGATVPSHAQAAARVVTRESPTTEPAVAPPAQAVIPTLAPAAQAGTPAPAPPVVVAIDHAGPRPNRDRTHARASAAALLREARAAATEGRTVGALDRYLGGAPNGVLVPEALYGRAQALARLGDHAAEIACWRRLVTDFPDSPYSAVARRRLSELP